LIILRFICNDVMELIEKSTLNNDLNSMDSLITLNTYDIHENVSWLLQIVLIN